MPVMFCLETIIARASDGQRHRGVAAGEDGEDGPLLRGDAGFLEDGGEAAREEVRELDHARDEVPFRLAVM